MDKRMQIVVGGVYRHYKGGRYLVIGTSLLVAEPKQYVVNYVPLYQCPEPFFCRDLDEFLSTVKDANGLNIPRYLFVERQGPTDILTILVDVLYSAQLSKIALMSFLARYNGSAGLDCGGLELALEKLKRSIP
jgi:hypothetical protein